MRKAVLYVLAPVLLVPMLPTALYYGLKPSEDQLHSTLRSFGFLPISLPSKLMKVGSLYYIDSQAKYFRAICHASDDDLSGYIQVSPGVGVDMSFLNSGEFATRWKFELSASGDGDLNQKHQYSVHFSLSEIEISEIPLGNSRKIFDKLMAKQECQDAVLEYIYSDGYVCQGQQILAATALYESKHDAQGGGRVHAQVDKEAVKDLLKGTVETHGNISVIEKMGKVMSGSALNYGVAMNPICLAPRHAIFPRVLPSSMLGTFINFIKYRVVEPLFAAT